MCDEGEENDEMWIRAPLLMRSAGMRRVQMWYGVEYISQPHLALIELLPMVVQKLTSSLQASYRVNASFASVP